jgi:RND family efflux transporter MFP subunit
MPPFVRPLLAVLLVVCATAPVAAHEGHAHGDEPPPVSVQTAPRATAVSELFQIVAVAGSGKLTLFLDRFSTNEPVLDALVDAETPDGPVTATVQGDIYRMDAPWSLTPGAHELLFTVSAGDDIDFLTATLTIPEPAAAAQVPQGAGSVISAAFALEITEVMATDIAKRLRGNDPAFLAIGALSFMAGVIMMALLRRRRLAAGVAATAVVMVFAGSFAFAQTAPAPVIRDVAQRLPDGRVFAPKPAQRILAIRTEPATEAEHHRSLELAGRVIPDPNASGFVQTAVGGRLSAPEGGFPSLGATVTAGQVLAIVEPSLAAIDQSSIRQAQAELDQEIAIAERQVERFRKLSASGALSQTQLEEAEINLTGLRERRAALDDVKLGAENLVAPISGVIASANAAQGLIAETNTIVFHIVDPARLWIEAISYSGDDVAQAASVSDGVDGAILLGFAGAGFADGSQAQPVLFRIEDEDSTLRPGQMVTVVAATSAAITGIAMPRDAVIRGTNGEYIVYVHTSPEMFEPRPVRMEPLDGAQVLIVAGVAPGDRVVTQGAELLNQLR